MSMVIYTDERIELVSKTTSGVDPTKLFFSTFFFFGVKLGHFTTNNFFLYVTKTQAYQRKTEKFVVSEEKKFGRIGSEIVEINFSHLSEGTTTKLI